MYAQAVDATDAAYGTLATYKWVASNIEFSLRSEKVSFSVHRQIASMPEADRPALIQRAADESWTVSDARKKLGKGPHVAENSSENSAAMVRGGEFSRRRENVSFGIHQEIAAKLANMQQGERTDFEPSANLPKVSQSEAADLLNVSTRTVEGAATVRNEGTSGTVIKTVTATATVTKD